MLTKFKERVIKKLDHYFSSGMSSEYGDYVPLDEVKTLIFSIIEEVEGAIGTYLDHNEFCECLEDENMPCDCGISNCNIIKKEIISRLNK